MIRKSPWTLCLSLLAALPALAPTAHAATVSPPCNPVVYVFRDAEGISTTGEPCLPGSRVQCFTTLSLEGKEHADQYLEMITAIGDRDNFCPVRAVYAVHPIKPSGASGTTAPYLTGTPLSRTVMDKDPHVEVDDVRLDETLMFADPRKLHAILVNQAKASRSTALFWTSPGLHELGVQLFATDVLPKKTQGANPPANGAYIFRYRDGETFAAPVKEDEYVQCFNFTNNAKPGDDFTNKFYCGAATNGNLTVPVKDFVNLHSRICNTLAADFTRTPGLPGYIGFCESPKSP